MFRTFICEYDEKSLEYKLKRGKLLSLWRERPLDFKDANKVLTFRLTVKIEDEELNKRDHT